MLTKTPRKRSDNFDQPALPMPFTIHEQPKRVIYDYSGRRVERAIGFKSGYVHRTDRED